MAFNFFKKKKQPDYDPLHITVGDLRLGFIFEYDLEQWEIQEEYTYDWGDNFFSKEFRISSGTKTHFLSVEDDDELEISVSDKIRIGMIEEDISTEVELNQSPPSTITFKGKKYHKDSEAPGFFKEENSKKDWVELISWSYYDEDDKEIITIEQWGEKEFEASHGIIIKDFEISNITPAE